MQLHRAGLQRDRLEGSGIAFGHTQRKWYLLVLPRRLGKWVESHVALSAYIPAGGPQLEGASFVHHYSVTVVCTPSTVQLAPAAAGIDAVWTRADQMLFVDAL